MNSIIPVPGQPESAPPSPQLDEELFSKEDQEILQKTRTLRQTLLKSLVPSDKLPENNTEKVIVIQLLDGLDKQVMNRAKLRATDKQTNAIQNSAQAVAETLRNYTARTSTPAPAEMRKLPDAVKVTDPVPGEMEIGTITVNMDEVTPKY